MTEIEQTLSPTAESPSLPPTPSFFMATRTIHFSNALNKINAFIAAKSSATTNKPNKKYWGDTKKNFTLSMNPAIL